MLHFAISKLNIPVQCVDSINLLVVNKFRDPLFDSPLKRVEAQQGFPTLI